MESSELGKFFCRWCADLRELVMAPLPSRRDVELAHNEIREAIRGVLGPGGAGPEDPLEDLLWFRRRHPGPTRTPVTREGLAATRIWILHLAEFRSKADLRAHLKETFTSENEIERVLSAYERIGPRDWDRIRGKEEKRRLMTLSAVWVWRKVKARLRGEPPPELPKGGDLKQRLQSAIGPDEVAEARRSRLIRLAQDRKRAREWVLNRLAYAVYGKLKHLEPESVRKQLHRARDPGREAPLLLQGPDGSWPWVRLYPPVECDLRGYDGPAIYFNPVRFAERLEKRLEKARGPRDP